MTAVRRAQLLDGDELPCDEVDVLRASEPANARKQLVVWYLED